MLTFVLTAAQEKAGETYQHSFRACVEHSLVCLLHEFQQTVAPFLLAMIHAVQGALGCELLVGRGLIRPLLL